MQQNLSHDLSLQHLVHDFDELSSWTPTCIDREQPYRGPHEAIPSQETEFTTEWQMVPETEAVYSS